MSTIAISVSDERFIRVRHNTPTGPIMPSKLHDELASITTKTHYISTSGMTFELRQRAEEGKMTYADRTLMIGSLTEWTIFFELV